MKFRLAPYLAALSVIAIVLSAIWWRDRSEQQLAFWVQICGSLLAVLMGIRVFKETSVPGLRKKAEDEIIGCDDREFMQPESAQAIKEFDRQLVEEALLQSEARSREKSQQLEETLAQLRSTQAQLIQTEKMSSLGQLVVDVAHELHTPVSFIHGNISYVNDYVQDFLDLVELYQQEYPQPSVEITEKIEEMDLDFLTEDLVKILGSIKVVTERIHSIVLSLRKFSRFDEFDIKAVDIHQGLESTLLILQNRFKGKNNYPEIQLTKEFGALPLVECYDGQLNRVFIDIITNAIDAIELGFKGRSVEEIAANPGRIGICTKVRDRETAIIEISDNGVGMSSAIKAQIFNPFFTTKAIGDSRGLGMSLSYQIVVKQHKGKLDCISEIGKGTTFIVEIPLKN